MGAGTHDGKFAILWEPLKVGTLGLAWIFGVCQAQINVTNASHGYADIANTDATKLTSNVAGGAQILWKESGTGTVWAVIRFVHSGYAHADPCA